MVFAEIKFDTEWAIKEHGWSNICAWIGGVIFLLVFLLCIVLSCLSPKYRPMSASYNQHTVPPVYNPSYNSNAKQNQGYQMQ